MPAVSRRHAVGESHEAAAQQRVLTVGHNFKTCDMSPPYARLLPMKNQWFADRHDFREFDPRLELMTSVAGLSDRL